MNTLTHLRFSGGLDAGHTALALKADHADTLDLACDGDTGCVPGALAVQGPYAGLPAGTLLGPEEKRPVLQVLANAWLPRRGGGAALCSWVKALEKLSQGDHEFILWKRGLSLAWVTASDKGFCGEREDTAGPGVEACLRGAMDLGYARGFILPDDEDAIRCLVTDLALFQRFDLVVVAGGTGLGPRDVSPEAVGRVMDRRLPGFERAMTQAGLNKTPHAIISRAVAGSAGRSIVMAVPGSAKGAAESVAAVAKALPHALAKLQGEQADCARR